MTLMRVIEGVILIESGGAFFRAHEKLEAGFFLVTDGQHHNGVTINAVSCDIAAITKVYQPVPELLGHILNGAANARQFSERMDTLDDGFSGPLSRCGVLGPQKLA